MHTTSGDLWDLSAIEALGLRFKPNVSVRHLLALATLHSCRPNPHPCKVAPFPLSNLPFLRSQKLARILYMSPAYAD
jgi:hypothetical protein